MIGTDQGRAALEAHFRARRGRCSPSVWFHEALQGREGADGDHLDVARGALVEIDRGHSLRALEELLARFAYDHAVDELAAVRRDELVASCVAARASGCAACSTCWTRPIDSSFEKIFRRLSSLVSFAVSTATSAVFGRLVRIALDAGEALDLAGERRPL